MIKFGNLFDNDNMLKIESLGNIDVFEYQKDLSVNFSSAATLYYASLMNIKKRQVLLHLENDAYILSAGAMQWTAGNVKMVSDVKNPFDFMKKSISGSVTGESTVKPKYYGSGLIMLEPTYRHILLEDIASWGSGLVLEDGLFLACQDSIKQKVVPISNLSSAVFSGEGLFNLQLEGNGIAVLESPVPRSELILVVLENDEIRIDGSFAIAWSRSLDFRVEKSTRSLLGSAVSGEGLVNVYRGTGKILMAPVA